MNREPLFDLYLTGELKNGITAAQVLPALSRLFKQPENTLQRLLQGRPHRIKRLLSQPEADRYQRALGNIGLLTAIKPSDAQGQKMPADDAAHIALSPPGSLVLTEQERAKLPGPEIDVSAMSLAPAGTPIENLRKNIPTRDPEIGHLSLAEAGADLGQEVLPVLELEINADASLTLAEPGSRLGTEKTAPPAPPNTDHLSFS